MREHSFLVQYRNQNNLTQSELAEEMGINPVVLSRIERNIGNMTVRLVLNWCKSKNISPDKIFPPEAAA